MTHNFALCGIIFDRVPHVRTLKHLNALLVPLVSILRPVNVSANDPRPATNSRSYQPCRPGRALYQGMTSVIPMTPKKLRWGFSLCGISFAYFDPRIDFFTKLFSRASSYLT